MTVQNVLRGAIALAGFLVAAAAFGAEPTNTRVTSAGPNTATTATGSLICRDRPRPGSHIAKRVCLTSAQWAIYPQAYPHETPGPWGQQSTTGASVGMSAFTAR